ncbi:hypothetical protein [Microbacterium candidum]|uniref:Uncharacterized protein n=1 Tax=Microbacterium candidum TaxID=3041922 RepID=A0ABT7N2D6_9MICO|nr:hypothetical protein [Microbacterium sp. ASV49]MDL9980859.1 hypothetical protein [Microbacterium sp. ASV49]
MTVRQVWWRVGLWAVVAGCLAVGVWVGSYGEWTMLFGFGAWPVVGAVILSERPRNGVGWYLIGMSVYAALMAPSLVPALMQGLPVWIELTSWAVSSSFWLLVPGIALVFPSGRIQTRLGFATMWIYIVDVTVNTFFALFDPSTLQSPNATGRANPLGIPAFGDIAHVWVSTIQYPAFIAVFVMALLDLILRWRRADATERLQYRWFVFGVSGMVVTILGALLLAIPVPAIMTSPIGRAIPTLALNLPALTIGIAITRHGLYSIGRVISRTVTYAIVLVTLVALYTAIVVGIGTLVPVDNPIPVALATVVAAAVFLPLLRWVQRWIDRRFDRARYDAERVVEAFGAKLQAGIDPETTVPELAAAVDEALRPMSIGVWRRS